MSVDKKKRKFLGVDKRKFAGAVTLGATALGTASTMGTSAGLKDWITNPIKSAKGALYGYSDGYDAAKKLAKRIYNYGTFKGSVTEVLKELATKKITEITDYIKKIKMPEDTVLDRIKRWIFNPEAELKYSGKELLKLIDKIGIYNDKEESKDDDKDKTTTSDGTIRLKKRDGKGGFIDIKRMDGNGVSTNTLGYVGSSRVAEGQFEIEYDRADAKQVKKFLQDRAGEVGAYIAPKPGTIGSKKKSETPGDDIDHLIDMCEKQGISYKKIIYELVNVTDDTGNKYKDSDDFKELENTAGGVVAVPGGSSGGVTVSDNQNGEIKSKSNQSSTNAISTGSSTTAVAAQKKDEKSETGSKIASSRSASESDIKEIKNALSDLGYINGSTSVLLRAGRWVTGSLLSAGCAAVALKCVPSVGLNEFLIKHAVCPVLGQLGLRVYKHWNNPNGMRAAASWGSVENLLLDSFVGFAGTTFLRGLM